uniref:Secreted protein n=1 Tax=Anguilla anguilla TaxID=7936 RepID=A0A0E9WCH8_ANGAN
MNPISSWVAWVKLLLLLFFGLTVARNVAGNRFFGCFILVFQYCSTNVVRNDRSLCFECGALSPFRR